MFSGERLICAAASWAVAVGVAGLAGGVVSGGAAAGVTDTGSDGVEGLPEVSSAITR